MKKFILCIAIAIFGVTAVGALPSQGVSVYPQKRGGDKKEEPREKKEPAGPPVVRDKEKKEKEKPKEPKRDKKPE